MKALCIVVVGVLLASSASGHQPLWPTDTPNGDVDMRDHGFPFMGHPNDIVMMGDDLFPFANDLERLREELFSLVHDCPEARATIYYQDMVESEITTACEVLKEAADRFHSIMRTNPKYPVEPEELDVFIFSSWKNMNEFWQDFSGDEASFSGIYISVLKTTFQYFNRKGYRWPGDSWQKRTEDLDWKTLAHEYVHYLDSIYNEHWGCMHWEGLAEYLSDYFDSGVQVIGDGSNLPSLLDTWYNRSDYDGQYAWGQLAVRFLFEEHPQVILDMYAKGCAGRENLPDNRWNVNANEALPPLNDDWLRWLREFTDFVEVRQIEPMTLFLRRKGDGSPIGWADTPPITYDQVRPWSRYRYYVDYAEPLEYDYAGLAKLRWSDYIHTRYGSQFCARYTGGGPRIRLGIAFEPDDIVVDFTESANRFDNLFHDEIGAVASCSNIFLAAVGTGTTEATLTVTAPNGKSTQQTFAITVVEDLVSSEIVVRDPLSTEEEYVAIDLSAYFTGPALKDIALTAESSNPDVAPVSLDDGRLVITTASVGEAQITVRGDYRGRVREHTFDIAVTDDCPLWLCKGTFTGWRSALLQPTTETSQTQTPETADKR